jgi:hypothetical protein
MTAAVSQAEAITWSVIGFFALIALLVFLRALLRREPTPPRWLRYRIGVFLERDPKDDQEDEEEAG